VGRPADERALLAIESKLDVRKPEPFTGKDPRKWRPFITECRLNFHAKPTIFQLEKHRVAFALSYLKETALNHMIHLLTKSQRHPALLQWDAFEEEFGRMFGPANRKIEAESAMRQMFMGHDERFSQWIVKFEAEAFETDWGEGALRSELKRSLPKRIRDILVLIPHVDNYRTLRDTASQIDQKHWEEVAEQSARNYWKNSYDRGTTQHGRYGGNYRNQTPTEDPNRGKPLNREPEQRLNAIEEGDEQWDDKEAGLNTIAGRREPP